MTTVQGSGTSRTGRYQTSLAGFVLILCLTFIALQGHAAIEITPDTIYRPMQQVGIGSQQFGGFLADGLHYYCGGAQGIAVYDWQTGALVRVLRAPMESISLAAFCPASGHLLVQKNDETMVFDINTGQIRHNTVTLPANMRCVTYSPTGVFLAAGLSEGQIEILRTDNWSSAHLLKVPASTVTDLTFSPDEQYLLAGYADGTFRYWSLATEEVLFERKYERWAVSCVAVNPCNDTAYVGIGNGKIDVFNLKAKSLLQSFSAHNGGIKKLMVSHKGELLSSIGNDKTLKIIDAIDFKIRASVPLGDLPPVNCQFSINDQYLLVNLCDTMSGPQKDNSKTLFVDVANGNVLSSINQEAPITAMALWPSGTHVFIGRKSGEIDLYETATWKKTSSFPAHTKEVCAIAVATDGTFMVSGGNDGLAVLWNLSTGAKMADFSAHKGAITAAAFSPDRSKFALACLDGTVRIRDLSGNVLRSWDKLNDTYAIKFSPSGDHLYVSPGNARLAAVLNLESGEVTYIEKTTGRALDISPDGSTLLFGTIDGIRGISPTTGRDSLFLKAPLRPDCVTYSWGGEKILIGQEGGVALLFNARDGKLLARFLGHNKPICQVALAPDQRWAYTLSYDGTVLVWPLEKLAQAMLNDGGATASQDNHFTQLGLFPGAFEHVSVEGNLAVVSMGNKFGVLDITAPEAIQCTASAELADPIRALCFRGGRIIAASQDTVNVFASGLSQQNLSKPTASIKIENCSNIVDIDANNDIIALAAGENGLYLLDAKTCSSGNISIVSQYTQGRSAYKDESRKSIIDFTTVFLDGNVLYFSDYKEGTLRHLDVSNPISPVEQNEIVGPYTRNKINQSVIHTYIDNVSANVNGYIEKCPKDRILGIVSDLNPAKPVLTCKSSELPITSAALTSKNLLILGYGFLELWARKDMGKLEFIDVKRGIPNQFVDLSGNGTRFYAVDGKTGLYVLEIKDRKNTPVTNATLTLEAGSPHPQPSSIAVNTSPAPNMAPSAGVVQHPANTEQQIASDESATIYEILDGKWQGLWQTGATNKDFTLTINCSDPSNIVASGKADTWTMTENFKVTIRSDSILFEGVSVSPPPSTEKYSLDTLMLTISNDATTLMGTWSDTKQTTGGIKLTRANE